MYYWRVCVCVCVCQGCDDQLVLSVNFSIMIILCGQSDLHHVEHGTLIPCNWKW